MSRIVGGSAGGRRLVTPRGRGTRPTSDRVREGLFSSLGGDLTGRSFLDLYAGSGAVGLEAASRGAAPVVLVERDPAALKAIRANAAALNVPAAPDLPAALGVAAVEVRADTVERFLSAAPGEQFDVVFVDPPYADPVAAVLARLVDRVSDDGVVVVERATRDQPLDWPPGLVADRSRRYGDSMLWYGRRP